MPKNQIEELQQAKRDMIRRLEEQRADLHEKAAKVGDQITKLTLGDRRG